MRRIWYCVAMSLDGYIAGPNGEYDWIPPEPAIDWNAFVARFDTVLFGRHSWEVSQSIPNGPAAGMNTFVFSRTLRPEDHPGITIASDNLAETIGAITASPGKDIWLFGGGTLFRSLLQLGAVDMIEVGLVPVLLGKGIPFLPGLDNIAPLALTDTHRYQSGIVMLTYRVSS